MSALLTWEPGRIGGERGKAGNLVLFSIHWGVKRQDDMWSLATTLPIAHPKLGQHYTTPDDAKAMAERLLRSFIRQIGATPCP